MKKLFISLITTSLCLTGFAQTNGQRPAVELPGVTVSPMNITYLNAVMDDGMPESVTELETRAARYDITQSEVFDGKFEAYEVMFEQSDGTIMATYNREGQIIESFERFKDITLPLKVRQHIYKNNPGWTIHSDVYLVTYYHDKGVNKQAKVQLRKEGKRKNIRINLAELYQS